MIFDSSQRTGAFGLLMEASIKEIPVTASTMLVIFIGVLIFAAFAGSLAWAQLYARPAGTAPVQAIRPRRRAF